MPETFRVSENPKGLEEDIALLDRRDEIEDHVVTQVLLPFRDEIAERREREAQVKAKYGLRSLDYLIQESNQKLLDYQLRQDAGEQMDMPMLNERRELERLETRRQELEREIRLERNLTVSEPRIIGAAVVVPMPQAAIERAVKPGDVVYRPRGAQPLPGKEQGMEYIVGAGMHPDKEIESVGMRAAMDYELGHGWHPEDVSDENLGFDVRSTSYNDDGSFSDVRYIEVKARAQSGAIRLTANEWKKARQFGDKFWLYIVTHAASAAPQLQRIPNPADQFQIGEDIFAAGYMIPEKNWIEKIEREPENPM